MRELIGLWLCRWTHPKPLWPIHGYYICRVCLRRYPVPWEIK